MKKEIWICDTCGAEFEHEGEYNKHSSQCLKKNYKVVRLMVSPTSACGYGTRYELTWNKYNSNHYDGGIHLWTMDDEDKRVPENERDYPRVGAMSHTVSMYQPRDTFGIEIPHGMEKEGLERLKMHFLEKCEMSKKLVLAGFEELERQMKREAKGENLDETMKSWEEVKKF